jgi:hypothetical protein
VLAGLLYREAVRLAGVLALILLASGCSSGDKSTAVLTATGRIGPLQMDRSTRADVIAFAGHPDAERRGRYSNFPPYRALGYDCTKERDRGFPLDNRTSCKTVFFVNQRTGRLGNFYTESSEFSERHGVRIGMRTAKAERLLHQIVYVGCEEDIHLGGRSGLTVAFTGGAARKLHESQGLHLIGGHVYAFALHGRRSELGVFDCL